MPRSWRCRTCSDAWPRHRLSRGRRSCPTLAIMVFCPAAPLKDRWSTVADADSSGTGTAFGWSADWSRTVPRGRRQGVACWRECASADDSAATSDNLHGVALRLDAPRRPTPTWVGARQMPKTLPWFTDKLQVPQSRLLPSPRSRVALSSRLQSRLAVVQFPSVSLSGCHRLLVAALMDPSLRSPHCPMVIWLPVAPLPLSAEFLPTASLGGMDSHGGRWGRVWTRTCGHSP
jgi:hypothetical protein